MDMAVRGYLTIVVTQASSRTKANDVVWDSTFAEGFVKGKKSYSAALQDDSWLIHASAVQWRFVVGLATTRYCCALPSSSRSCMLFPRSKDICIVICRSSLLPRRCLMDC